MGILGSLFGAEKKDFPPLPKWNPAIVMPMDKVIDRFAYYTDGNKDFVVFSHGTCVIVPDGLSDEDAKRDASDTLDKILNYHPDMNPLNMDDGNILIQYNHPACNIVLSEVVSNNWEEIKERHQDALTRDEVLITPLGANKFDDFGIKALFGRCYFFMDATNPVTKAVIRKKK